MPQTALNRKSKIANLKSNWRRGWDSTPRYGSPYTAFPVLPIQPLLHLSVLWSADFSRQSIAYPGDACHVTTPRTRHVRDERRKMSMAARIEKKWCAIKESEHS